MDEFRHTFVRLCRDNHTDPPDFIIHQLKSFENTSKRGKAILDLSTNSLSPKPCHILGKVIATDRTFLEYKFADCMLSEDAVKGISNGFAHNSYCKSLDMKGNNIRGAGAEALGKMLHHNQSLLKLCLEWNALGMLDNSFSLFCEGLGSNECLQALDLRNNQINHDCAIELAANLKRNKTLRAIDLRWNNVGLLGGRAILEMLHTNKTVCRLELAGNNIPGDILKSIETAIGQNEDRAVLSEDHKKKMQMLTKHVKQIETDKSLQMNDLMDTIEKQEDVLRNTKRTTTQQVAQLQEALEERKSSFNALASKLSMTESELALQEQKTHDVEIVVERLKQELSGRHSSHNEDLRKERETRATMEAQLHKELSESSDKNIQLQAKLDDTERKCRLQQDQIFELKEQVTHLQAEIKIKGAHFEERLQSERNRHKEDLRDAEQIRQKEVSRVRQDADEVEANLRERIQQLEMTRLELEEEISRQKNHNMSNKLQHEEQLTIVKQKFQSEEENRYSQLEEKLRVTQLLKDEVQSRCNQQNSTVSDLTSRNSTLTLETETMKKRVEEMQQELAEKNAVTFAEVGKVKLDLNQALNKLEAERKVQTELRDQLSDSDRKTSEQILRYREACEEKDAELDSLRRRLKSRELEVSHVREEESQRAKMLQMAVLNYCQNIPQSTMESS
ncbi:leucine-rich repeat-containing protein 45-like [Mytilus californianus]|uniref:leucine-rich repeat-containing protein 45-like n=1 Tax=Mytilus californianus TaxID=6549 RepID=UPI002246577A|nr:leucine-rich repeat-containing protein 45-like [Mytilus californianus]XP_052068541.1 leucine-rich repeat-containing protein 45-like [Mytilus californianus]